MKCCSLILASGERVIRVVGDDFILDVTDDDSMIPISGTSPEHMTKNKRLTILNAAIDFRLHAHLHANW